MNETLNDELKKTYIIKKFKILPRLTYSSIYNWIDWGFTDIIVTKHFECFDFDYLTETAQTGIPNLYNKVSLMVARSSKNSFLPELKPPDSSQWTIIPLNSVSVPHSQNAKEPSAT